MKAPYREGIANRPDLESCVGVREGAGEALTGAPAGRVSSREITYSGMPTLSCEAEGHIGYGRHRKPVPDPPRS